MKDSLEDDRPVTSVILAHGARINIGTNDNGLKVEKLQVYAENGQMAGVPWLAVIVDGHVVERHDLVGGSISYREQQEPVDVATNIRSVP